MTWRYLASALVSVSLGLGCGADTGASAPTGAQALDSGPVNTVEDVPIMDAGPDAEPGVPGPSSDIVSLDAGDAEAVEPPNLCATAQCDDGLACTDDGCDPGTGACTWTLASDACLIGGACYLADERHPNDPCRTCDADGDAYGWSEAGEGAACDDGDACTAADICSGGLCAGVEADCWDGDPCTLDSCDVVTGCANTALGDGGPCDDEDVCTVEDTCEAGECAGEPVECDDDDPCTDEVCVAGEGCVMSFNQAPCDDGAPCTDGDLCQDGACAATAETNCDDGDVCTIDLCDEVAGCVHLPTQNACCTGETSTCTDGNPCTTATCDEVTGACVHVLNSAACDDGNACTVGDVCADGDCAGEVIVCDDDNPCTDDLCSPADGCVHVPQSGTPCDDLIECTTEDTCQSGECVGDASACSCTPVFHDAGKATWIEMGTSGQVGEGLDIDGDPSTCAPEGECAAGVDNALAILAGFANESIADAVVSGKMNFIVELREAEPEGLALAAYVANLDPANIDCDFQSSTCQWQVAGDMLDEELCTPITILAATVEDNVLTGGGADSSLPFLLPLGDSMLSVSLTNLRFVGQLTYEAGQVVSFSGVFGGAIPKVALEAALDSVPDEDLPLPKAAIVGFLGMLEDDIDTDGDGVKDALSLGLKVSGIDGVITGTY